jgi:D-amino-acid oxidase
MKDRIEGTGRVVVIGAGVIGLTTALGLRRRGWQATVIAERFAPQVTSAVAGALWEWPPAVCGHQPDLARACRWAAASYRIFEDLASDSATGAFIRPVTFYFRRRIDSDPVLRDKMNAVAAVARGFRHDSRLIVERGVNPNLGLVDAYTHLAPMIDTDAYLAWLMDAVRAAGCRLVERKIAAPLKDREAGLLHEFGATAIVNCTGLGARELGDPTVYPLRGAVLRVRNDGRTVPRIEEAHCISHDGTSCDPGFVFIVPRGRDRLVLGGFAEPHEAGLDIGWENYEPIRAIHRRCVEFLPALRDLEIDAVEPVRVGLRPARVDSVRLEWEAGTRIVHNYGHGGSGVTFSWGCAAEAADLVEACGKAMFRHFPAER